MSTPTNEHLVDRDELLKKLEAMVEEVLSSRKSEWTSDIDEKPECRSPGEAGPEY